MRCRDGQQRADDGHDVEDARDPGRRVRIGDELERLHEVLLAAERRRQRVDDPRHQIDHGKADHVTDDGEHGAHREDQRERSDRGENQDVIDVERLYGRRFPGNRRPLRPGGEQDVPDAVEQCHGVVPSGSRFDGRMRGGSAAQRRVRRGAPAAIDGARATVVNDHYALRNARRESARRAAVVAAAGSDSRVAGCASAQCRRVVSIAHSRCAAGE